MRSDITPGQTSDYLGFDLVMDDNLPEPCVLLASFSATRLWRLLRDNRFSRCWFNLG